MPSTSAAVYVALLWAFDPLRDSEGQALASSRENLRARRGQGLDNCLPPHDWKHSYATIGARRLKEWYKGNPYNLHECCMHEKFETTLKYVNQKGDEFLKSFSQKQDSAA